ELRQISGTATYQLQKANDAKEIVLDTKALTIKQITDGNGKEIAYTLSDNVEFLGRALHIPLSEDIDQITIQYQTTDSSAALQWLNPEQTAGKKQPFLFTQSQAILARTWLPCQDSPGIRYTYK